MNLTGQEPYQKGLRRKREQGKTEREHPAFKYGTDAEFLDWLTYQPSCIDRQFGQYQGTVGRNMPCHVRRISAGAGGAIKPPFSAVAMTDEQHQLQHKGGELAVLLKFTNIVWDKCSAKRFFKVQAEKSLNLWIRSKLNAAN